MSLSVGPDITILFSLLGGEAFSKLLPASFELSGIVRRVVLLAQALQNFFRVLQETTHV
jgi:hypothetical protein